MALTIGICNGSQALIKLGLVPYGHIVPLKDDSPTLTFNTIGRHISRMVDTKVVSNKSPWLSLCEPGDIHTIAVSHGEGRFVATEEEIKHLVANGQIGTQYVDLAGNPTMESPYNPNGSFYAGRVCYQPRWPRPRQDGPFRTLHRWPHEEHSGQQVPANLPVRCTVLQISCSAPV